MVRQRVLSLNVCTGNYRQFIDNIFDLTETRLSSYVCFANVHMAIEAHQDSHFKIVVNEADLVTPDGKPIALFLRWFRRTPQDRVSGPDVFIDLLREAARRKKSVFFYGSTTDVLQRIVMQARHEFPSLTIAGTCSPP